MSSGGRLAAFVRMATGLIFTALGVDKVLDGFVRGEFAKGLPAMEKTSWPFWGAFLHGTVAPRSTAFAWIVAVVEIAVGIALLLGLRTRVAAAGGAILMVFVLLGQSYVPGGPWIRWLTAGLATRFALLLLLLLAATDAGRVWGFDGRRVGFGVRRGSLRR